MEDVLLRLIQKLINSILSNIFYVFAELTIDAKKGFKKDNKFYFVNDIFAEVTTFMQKKVLYCKRYNIYAELTFDNKRLLQV